MSALDAVAAVQGIQATLARLQVGQSTAPGGADVFGVLLAGLTGGAAGATTFGQRMVEEARSYLGTPYVLGGESRSGIDCSGLVQSVLGELGVDAPRLVRDQATIGTEVPSLAEAQPGDLIVFPGHIGIYAGDNKVIHAPSPGRTVTEQELWTGDEGITTIRRIQPAASAALPAGVDAAALLQGLALLGGLAGSLRGAGGEGLAGGVLGSSVLGSTALGTTALGSSLLGAPTAAPDALTALQLARWTMLNGATR